MSNMLLYEELYVLGSRVEVDIKEIPKNERDCEVGYVIAKDIKVKDIKNKNIADYVFVTIRFDRNYIKKEFRCVGGITEVRLNIKSKNIYSLDTN